MISPADIASNPDWIPHRVDWNARQVEFLQIPGSEFTKPGFLADYQTQDKATASVDEVMAMEVESGPLHFIFHTAFCRSTLLSKALNIPSVSVGMSEPGIFANLSGAGDQAAPLVQPIMRLLARKRSDAQAVFVKPTNHSNRLIPQLLQSCGDARSILMSNPLETFLESVARKGMHGRRWARNLLLEMQSYAGMDFGMDERELFCMSDMQAAGLAWFLNQNYFHALASSAFGPRLRVLDGDIFNAERAVTIGSVLEFAGVEHADTHIADAVNGPAFATHSKLGGGFDGSEPQSKAGLSDTLSEEIAQVAQWVGMIIQQTGQPLPLKQTLFAPQ
ncbi:hypothetical protein [Erythrobacter crassostreae]|uniref:Uncharacterized protein n=1 Tax=Erythrobacter crassostreae TaxID=2828328 RepID=A0A9X1F3U1_9SPHN|nr:hypothetical protein [Erythrobacter crassostrea]MBV7259249.1 hypothetical protein [Erythrobacter crassostrea]